MKQFWPWSPIVLGILLIAGAIAEYFTTGSPRSHYPWLDPGTRKVMAVIIAAFGVWMLAQAAMKRR